MEAVKLVMQHQGVHVQCPAALQHPSESLSEALTNLSHSLHRGIHVVLYIICHAQMTICCISYLLYELIIYIVYMSYCCIIHQIQIIWYLIYIYIHYLYLYGSVLFSIALIVRRLCPVIVCLLVLNYSSFYHLWSLIKSILCISQFIVICFPNKKKH